MTTNLPPGLKLFAAIVRATALLAAAAILLGAAWIWSDLDRLRAAAPFMTTLGSADMLIDNRARWLGVLAIAPETVATLVALWQLWVLFGEYREGRCFAPGTQVSLRRFAWAWIVASVIAPLDTTLVALAFTSGMPPGRHMLVLGFSSESVLAIVASAVFLAIALILSEASRIAEENGQFV